MEPSPPDPAPETADVPAAPAKPRPRVLRQVLVVGLSVLALLCLGGGAAAFLFYDKATKPDLSTPALVTREYLSAYLVNRDDARATEFQCGDHSGLKNVRALRDDLDSRQKTYNVSINVSIDSVFEESRSGDEADLAVDIVLSTTSNGSQLRRVQRWQFTARDENGWRVCSGHEVT